MSAKIQKVIARQQQKVEEGLFYEAHQQLRVIAARYIKAADYESAIDILCQGATMLLRANQGGSGGDLCMMMMEVYHKASVESDVRSKARLLYLLRAFPKGEPTRKRFVGEMIAWSSKWSEYPAGDPELHHVAGSLFAEEGDILEAERHLTLGTGDSPGLFASLEYQWYTADEPSAAPMYAARGVFAYLLVGNVRAANKVMLLFSSKLAVTPGLSVQTVESTTSDLRVYPSMPLLNFLSLLLLALQRGSADLYRQLQVQYGSQIKQAEATWREALQQIGEMYFGIKAPSQSNPLMDMMGSFLMGGSGGGGGSAQKKQPSKPVTAPAPAPALD